MGKFRHLRSSRKLGLLTLLLLSLLNPIGFIFKSQNIQNLGILLSASPFAEVFTDKPEKHDYWASSFELSLKGEPHETKFHWITHRGAMSELGKHHLTQVFHAIPLVFTPFFGPQASLHLITPLFCHPKSVLPKNLGWKGERIRSFSFEIRPRNAELTRTIRGDCP